MSKRILIVDDHETVLFAMWDYLTTRHYTVDRAANRAAAERLLDSRSYAVVITDLSLNSRDGSESLEVLRCVQERCPTARTILLTTHSSFGIEAEALRRGAHMVLPVPWPLARLANVVADLMHTTAKCAESAAGAP